MMSKNVLLLATMAALLVVGMAPTACKKITPTIHTINQAVTPLAELYNRVAENSDLTNNLMVTTYDIGGADLVESITLGRIDLYQTGDAFMGAIEAAAKGANGAPLAETLTDARRAALQLLTLVQFHVERELVDVDKLKRIGQYTQTLVSIWETLRDTTADTAAQTIQVVRLVMPDFLGVYRVLGIDPTPKIRARLEAVITPLVKL